MLLSKQEGGNKQNEKGGGQKSGTSEQNQMGQLCFQMWNYVACVSWGCMYVSSKHYKQTGFGQFCSIL